MKIIDYGFEDNQIEKNTNEIVARIIETHKDRYKIVSDMGEGYAKLKSSVYYNQGGVDFPTTGDFVLVLYNESGESIITETLKRKTCFSRLDPYPDKKYEQVVASNFDYVFIMQSLNNNFNLRRIERYLTLSWQSKATPVIILTKSDLVDNIYKYMLEVEEIALGVNVHAISCKTGQGLDEIDRYFKKGKTIVFLGSSGVGKSTLVNTLFGEEIIKTQEIREDDSRGRHTTTSRQLIMLPNGSMIIDTPGMRELGMWDVSEGLDATFSDVEKYIGKCKFSNCTHSNEPGCKILEAIEEGELSQERFDSYIKLKNEARYNENSEAYLEEKRKKFKEISKHIKNIKDVKK